ncbi:ABC transporter ATP-binding protein [Zongyangia hominis]|uniref:ATP-binding cassette domain-containing protein n=1 Tax=Zongyangia hominis TaxID=2763677 RepID=A0A926EFI3_9FIRM|nr:ATP-binding cassette domain-containing protein [Zongyangia hominis]MBC8570747.1 ATP-binding cassette domain-containing protein [Zongyangia hominis]
MLELKHISVDVAGEDGEKGILKNVNLTVDDGKFVVITGPNGGGKSTLAKVVAGINPPTEGQIFFDGQDITGLGITERAKLGISFAFQQPVRFKGITVRDMVELAAGEKIEEEQLCGYLRDVGLCAKDYIDREINASLSGGEIKRIEIAMVMARKTRLTIFDEPEAGIDLWSFNNLIDVFQRMRREIRGSIVIISHQERILGIADEIVVLSGGVITAHGPRDEILPTLLGDDKCQFCPKLEEA